MTSNTFNATTKGDYVVTFKLNNPANFTNFVWAGTTSSADETRTFTVNAKEINKPNIKLSSTV